MATVARRRWYGSDRGLTTRMTLTLFGLGLIYVDLHRRADRGRHQRDRHPADRRRLRARPDLLRRQARPRGDAGPRHRAPRGPGAARDDRAPLPARRPPQAEGRGLADGPAQRVRGRAQPQDGDGLRDDRADGAPRAARARGRAGPRAVAHRQQGRRGDDRRGLPRDRRRPAGPLRPLQRHDGRPQPRQHAPWSSWSWSWPRWSSTCCRSCCCGRSRATASTRPTAARRSSPARRPSSRRRSQKISGTMARIPTRDLRAAEGMNAFFIMPAVSKGFSLSSIVVHPPPDGEAHRAPPGDAGADRRRARGAGERGPHRQLTGSSWACSTSCGASARPSAPTSTRCSPSAPPR